jgi:long-subunit acyl-CoA synthetase (AMP-forming)
MGMFSKLIKTNKTLTLVDSETSEFLNIKDLESSAYLNKQTRTLAFLYLDNSLNSVKTLLSFFESPHVCVLLNPKLNENFKTALEETFIPNIIFDPVREFISTYQSIEFLPSLYLFEKKEKTSNILNPKLKVLLTTSGTTGSPKLVKLSEDNIIANAKSITEYLPIKSDDVTPLNLSIFYSYGLSILTSNCLKGGTIVCTNKDVMSKDFWDDFKKWGYTSLAGVPYVYEMLYRIGFLEKEYPSLRYMTQAGGKLSTKLVSLFSSHLKKQKKLFYVMYGQTEATARMSYLPPQYLEQKIGSIGLPIPQGSFLINKETSELIYTGPNVFGGYATNKEDLAIYEHTESLSTGDIAEKDDQGFYYITGRLKRFAKIFGIRTNLDEVEDILKNQFTGQTFVVWSENDEKLLIGLLGNAIAESDIKFFIKDKLQIHPSVIKIVLLTYIPLTSNGKVDYNAIKNG